MAEVDFEVVEEKVSVDIQDVLELPEGSAIITVNKDLYHGQPIDVLVSVMVKKEMKGKGPFVKVNLTAAGKKRAEEAKKLAEEATAKLITAAEKQAAADKAEKEAAEKAAKPVKTEPEPVYTVPPPPSAKVRS